MERLSERDQTVIVFALIERILGVLRESGATEEESIAAVRSAEAIVPILRLESKWRSTL